MAHDFSHLDEAAFQAISDSTIVPACDANSIRAIDARTAILSALTPSDLAALLAEKCPGWVAVPNEITLDMLKEVNYGFMDNPDHGWKRVISAAPKLGDEQ